MPKQATWVKGMHFYGSTLNKNGYAQLWKHTWQNGEFQVSIKSEIINDQLQENQ